MGKLQLTFACGNYDRTQALRDGRVQPDGIDLNYLALTPPQLFPRMLEHREFEASELSLSGFLKSCCRDNPPFIAIPVFPSRAFRHSILYVNTDSGIDRPQDLKGKRLGASEYSSTASVWVRGILQHEYGVHLDEIHWLITEPPKGRDVAPGRGKFEIAPAGKDLIQMLSSGEIDALMSLHPVLSSVPGNQKVRRLFPNFKEVEKEYYLKTKIIPIMHIVVLRSDIYERYPWAATSLYRAFQEAKNLCLDSMLTAGAPPITLHWFLAELEEERELFGDDLYPYGLEPNRHVLETLISYAREQGMIDRSLEVESLFASETLKI